MKKKQLQIIILISIILLGSVYLILSNSNKMYTLPEFENINPEELTKITIDKQETNITLQMLSDDWVIMPDEYKVDPAIMESIFTAISEITLTELISTSEQYSKYSLDDASKTRITVYNGDYIVRQFDIGRESSSYQHTFLRRIDDPDIYQARGNLVATFNKETEAIRDKLVLSLNTEDILIITAKTADGMDIIINKTYVPAVQTEETASDSPLPEPEEIAIWQTTEGVVYDTGEIDNLLAPLSNLKCTGYAEEGIELPEVIFEITLKGSSEYNLKVYGKIDDNYIATSSMNDYVFYLPSWQVENAIGVFAPSEE